MDDGITPKPQGSCYYLFEIEEEKEYIQSLAASISKIDKVEEDIKGIAPKPQYKIGERI